VPRDALGNRQYHIQHTVDVDVQMVSADPNLDAVVHVTQSSGVARDAHSLARDPILRGYLP
jgi:hypothetical protein